MDTGLTIAIIILFGFIGFFIRFFLVVKITRDRLNKASEIRVKKIREALYDWKIATIPDLDPIQEDVTGLTPIKNASISIIQKIYEFDPTTLTSIKEEAENQNNQHILRMIKSTIG
ncbi:hypothetical protein [Breznakiella homolactica]|uniref:Uncharacterized protein n=1 Tax=Breznakiella homolactica TaxID=2798577 RepID=A0A7T7XNI0_9SPIR|nr:hypothetical protein [Breznakiella homolactica]QQO09586.1 hypothetical protein JFL75_01315 [Breznakiella homolactica]